MAGIRGELDVVGLANLLQLLSFLPGEGYLTLRRGPQRKVLHVSPQGLRLVAGARVRRPLGDFLVRTGRIRSEQLPWLLALHRSLGKPLGETLARYGFVKGPEIEGILRERVLEHVYELFMWSDASFEYTRAADVPAVEEEGPLASFVVDFDPVGLTLEVSRRVDELEYMRKVIPDGASVPARGHALPVPLPTGPGLDPVPVAEIFSLVDGRRTVDGIVDESVFPRFTVLRALFSLAGIGAVIVRRSALPSPAGP